MRVLVLGGTGMLGHVVWRACDHRFETTATVRRPTDLPGHALDGVDALRPDSVVRALEEVRPGVVVNCVGAIKQRPEADDLQTAIAVNALFPHLLAAECGARGVRLIHVSTDCVFSGERGGYREDDPPDPVDVYGRTKLLGEPVGALTLRMSLFGREVDTAFGIVEWFLAQDGPVNGFTRAVFSGIATIVAAELIVELIEGERELSGLWHVAAEPVNKHDLLVMIRDEAGLGTEIRPVDEPVIDRSLDGSRFRDATGWSAPTMHEMIRSTMADAR